MAIPSTSPPLSEEQFTTIVFAARPDLQGKVHHFGLMIDGAAIGEMNVVEENRVMLPPGKHRISLVDREGRTVGNELEFDAMPGQSARFDFGKSGLTAAPPLAIGPAHLSKDQRPRFKNWAGPLLIILVAVLILGFGAVRFTKDVISPVYSDVLSRTPSVSVPITFWNSVLSEGDLTPQARSSLSPELDQGIDIDWARIARNALRSAGPNRNTEVIFRAFDTPHGQSWPKLGTAGLKISGEFGAIHIVTFLTRESSNAKWRIAGFDIFDLRPDTLSYSRDLPEQMPSDEKVTVGRRIYQ